MEKLQTRLLTTVAFVALSSAAYAADMPTKALAPPPPPVFSWTGFYIGGNVGGGWGHSSETPGGLFAATTGFSGTINRSGVTAGGQLGYNWQIGSSVWGFETDFNYLHFQSQSLDIAEPAATAFGSGLEPNVQTYNVGREDFFGTVRARLGYAFNRLLAYGTGGFAYGSRSTDSVTYTNSVPGVTYAVFQGSSNNVGWTAGGGLEYAFTNNWSVRAEYLYVDLNSNRTLVPVSVIGTPATGFSFSESTGRFNVARVGLDYKFGF